DELAMLAERFPLAGGGLKNVVLDATFRAIAEGREGSPVVGVRHLIAAIAREYQKAGKPITKGEFGTDFHRWVEEDILESERSRPPTSPVRATPQKDTVKPAAPVPAKTVPAPQKRGGAAEILMVMRSLASLASPADASQPVDPPLGDRSAGSDIGRARLSASIQRSVGNARLSRMLAPVAERRCAC